MIGGSYITAGLAGVAILAVVYAGVQSSRLSSVRADLTTSQADLATAKANVVRIARDRVIAITALTNERERAVLAEQKAADLREMIARDAGTARDGETAPILRDVIRGLQRTSSRGVDSEFTGRREVWILTVHLAGRLVVKVRTEGREECVQRANAGVIEIRKVPEIVSSGQSVVVKCTRSVTGGITA